METSGQLANISLPTAGNINITRRHRFTSCPLSVDAYFDQQIED